MDGPPRSLSDWLRSRADDELAALLTARPDLAVPVPPDIGVLASRACVRLSVARALEAVDRFGLEVLDALTLLAEPASYADLQALVGAGASDAQLRPAVARLRELALVWGADEALHVVRTAREVLPPYPARLGRPVSLCLERHTAPLLLPLLDALDLPPARPAREGIQAIAELFGDPDRLQALVDKAGDGESAVLRQLAAGPPIGEVRDALRPVRPVEGASPVRWLLARGLLVAIDTDTVELPREVGLLLRGGQPLGELHPRPPVLDPVALGAVAVDSAAGQQAAAALGLVESLLEMWGLEPPAELRAGGLGVRELRRTARDLDVSEAVAALLIETAAAAGLLDISSDGEGLLLPTPAYDGWLAQPPEVRWAALAAAWLANPRLPGLVGERDDRDKVLAALGPELERTGARAARVRVLAALAALPPGKAASAEQLLARLTWESPRHGGRLRDRMLGWALSEADTLGVTGRGALTSAGRALLDDEPRAVAAALAPRLPQPVDHVLVQADLTVVAPGPLEPALGRELGLVAEVESSGGATVYRVTEATVRRALDAGRSAAELHELFGSRSRTPVPQALTYLVDDVARRHGRLRVGTATCYLRCDDEALLSEVLVARKAAPLRLRRLAPTVLTAVAPVGQVLEMLRALGHAPVAESADGAVVLARRDSRRTTGRPRLTRTPWDPPRVPVEQLIERVHELRAADRAARAARRSPVTQRLAQPGSASNLAWLQEAAAAGQSVWLGYVDATGQASERIVDPLSVEGGYLRAYDERQRGMRTFALHRITGVAEVTDAE